MMAVQKPPEAKVLYTVEEFEQIADSPENVDRLLELIEGEIVEKMPTEEHSEIAGNILVALKVFTKPQRLGRTVMEVRYRVPGDTRNARIPDVAFTLAKNTKPVVTKGSVTQLPDIAVEVKSPDQNMEELRKKAEYFLTHGVKIVWLINPKPQIVEVCTLAEDGTMLTRTLAIDGTLDGGDVLPGFTLSMKDVFDLS
jgi:Uma2 family endonuclease